MSSSLFCSISGKDHGVDYARIDNNSELDDLNMEDQEKILFNIIDWWIDLPF